MAVETKAFDQFDAWNKSEEIKAKQDIQADVTDALTHEPNPAKKEQMQQVADKILAQISKEKLSFADIAISKQTIALPDGKQSNTNGIVKFLFSLSEKQVNSYTKALTPWNSAFDKARWLVKASLENFNLNADLKTSNETGKILDATIEAQAKALKSFDTNIKNALWAELKPLDDQKLAQKYGYNDLQTLEKDYTNGTGKFKDSPIRQSGADRGQVLSFLQVQAEKRLELELQF